jgi:hypothetical protein
MFVVFAFVDIAWTPQACVFLALCMATCVNMVRVSQGESDQGDDRGTRDKGSRPARRPVPSSPRPPVDIHVPDAREAPEREALREGALESISFVS